MKNLKTRLAVLLLSTFCLLTAAYGQFTPSDDSYTDSLAPTVNYGTQPTLQMLSQTVHGHAPAVDSTFIRFDLTAVPTGYTGASVAKATLKLFVNAVRKNGSFNVNLVNGAWTEKALTYDNQPAITTTLASSIPLTAISNNATYVEIDITPAVVDWLNNTDPNDGIALVPTGGLYATFDSKENTGTSHLPELDIVFVGGVSSVTTPNGSGLMGGGTGNVSLSLTNSCNINQVLSYNGDEWVCHTVSGSGGGTVTSVGSGTGLTGGPITTS